MLTPRSISIIAATITLAAAWMQPAVATQEFCVDSVSEFNAAYEVADEENVVIRIEQGSYDMTGSCIDPSSPCGIDDDVTLIGGYTNGCASRSGNATLTVLTRPGGGLTLSTSGSSFSGNGDLVLRGLTFRNAPNGVRMFTENEGNPDAYISINQVWFDRAPVSIAKTAEVRLRNTLVTGATTECGLKVEGNPGDGSHLEILDLKHVTIADNDNIGLCAGSADTERFELNMVNTIIWGNAVDIDLRPVANAIAIAFLNNTYAILNTTVPLIGESSGRLNSDPQFVNIGSNDFELGGSSTSINSAFPLGDAETDKDLKGDNRRFSIFADRGALESAIGSTATVLTVTNTADTGLGSLRQAVSDANQSPNLNYIHFDIGSTCGPRLINLQSPLPQILGSLVVDGYTQPGAARNTQSTGNNATLCIVLQQPAGSFANNAFLVTAAADDDVSLRVDGIGFSNFLLGAVTLGGGNGHSVVGSQFGGDVASLDLLPSGYGVQTDAGMRGITIGGPDPEDRNTFTEAVIAGISIAAASAGEFADAVIQNNHIGLTRTGLTAQANNKGIIIRGAGNRVTGNTISANSDVGIELVNAGASDNIIEYNRIGRTAALCILGCDRGNGDHGVLIHNGATRNQVRYNDIWYNQGDGISIVSAESNPVYQNDWFDNGGEPLDLGTTGRTVNDNDSATPPANAGNRNQNYPVLSTVVGGDRNGMASGSFSSVNGWFRIEFYAVDACPAPFPQVTAEARYYIGSTTVQITNAVIGNDGTATFSNAHVERQNDPDFFAVERGIVATATRYSANPLAGGNRLHTSEFSTCRTYVNSGELFASGFE